MFLGGHPDEMTQQKQTNAEENVVIIHRDEQQK